MSLKIKIAITIVGCTLVIPASAQYGASWGAGMYGGTSSCQSQSDAPNIGDEATDIADDISTANDDIKDLQDEVKEAKKDLRDKSRDLEKAQQDFQRTGYSEDSKTYQLIQRHIEQRLSCSSYGPGTGESSDPYSAADWARICPANSSQLNADVLCHSSKPSAPVPPPDRPRRERGGDRDRDIGGGGTCASSLADWQKSFSEKQAAQEKMDRLDREIKDKKKSIAELKGDFKKAVKDHAREEQNGGAEGACYECMLAGNSGGNNFSHTNALQVGGDVALGLGAMLMGSSLNKSISKNNAALGYPTPSVSSASFGYPYFAGALYGAMSGGGGSGSSFGCGSSMGRGSMSGGNMTGGIGGAFGYPGSMYGQQMGGGMFSAGMGGMMNPYGGMSGMGGMGGMGGMMNPYSSMYGGMTGMNGLGMMGGMNSYNPYGSMMGMNNMGSMYGMGGMSGMNGMNGMYGMGSSMNPYASMYGLGSNYGFGMQMPQYSATGTSGLYSTQTTQNLYREMYQLMAQIQQVQSGVSTGGVYTPSYYGNYGVTGTSSLPGVSGTTNLLGSTTTVR